MFSFIFTMLIEGIILVVIGLIFFGIVFNQYRTRKLGSDYSSVFRLDPDVINHNGKEIEENTLFFIEPPKEIGRLISANSTLTKNHSTIESGNLVLCFIGVLFITVGMFFISAQLTTSLETIWRILGILLPTGVVFAISSFFTDIISNATNIQSSYVGEKGFIEYNGWFANKNIVTANTLQCLFEDYDYLYVNNVHKYNQGHYTGFDYKYIWTGLDKNEIIIKGLQKAKIEFETDKEVSLRYYFTQSCKNAWDQHILNSADEKYNRDRVLKFESYQTIKPSKELNLDPDISISDHEMDIVFRSAVLKITKYEAVEKRVQINSADIKKIGIKDEEYLYTNGIKRYSGVKPILYIYMKLAKNNAGSDRSNHPGKYAIRLDDIPNTQLFFWATEKLLSQKIQNPIEDEHEKEVIQIGENNFAVRFASEERFKKILKPSVWESTGELVIQKESIQYQTEKDDVAPLILNIKDIKSEWIGSGWPNGHTDWFVISDGTDKFYFSANVPFEQNAKETKIIYQRILEAIKSQNTN